MAARKLEVVVGVADGSVEVEAEIAGVKVLVEGGDEGVVARLRGGGEVLEVERQTAIVGVGGEEEVDLMDEIGAAGGVQEEVAYGGVEDAGEWVVVVDEREDFSVDSGFGDDVGDLVLGVDGVDSR